MQPVEKIGTKYVVYGIGNFLSNQSGECCPTSSQDGVIVTLHFTQTAGEVERRQHHLHPDLRRPLRWLRGRCRSPPTYKDPTTSPALKQQLAASFQRTVSAMSALRAPDVTPDAHPAGPVSVASSRDASSSQIASADDPRLADYRSLTDVALRRKVEPEHGLFIAEGEKVVRRAVAAGYELRSLLVAHARGGRRRGPAGTALRGGLRRARSGHRLSRPSRRAGGDGPPPAADASSRLQRGARRLMVLEELSSTTNLGAVFRSAAALGMDGIILAPTCGDPLYRRAVRVSMGQVFAIPYARCESWPARARRRFATRVGGCSRSPRMPGDRHRRAAVGPADRLALLLGAEGSGLRRARSTRRRSGCGSPWRTGSTR